MLLVVFDDAFGCVLLMLVVVFVGAFGYVC